MIGDWTCLPCLRQVNRQAGFVLLYQGKRIENNLLVKNTIFQCIVNAHT